jgi:DNA repair exonuclease SbcCD nuclease subunit
LPIFTIHGNHDYPSNDFGKISVCDLLHASNYVNYFGKHLNMMEQGMKKIIVKPITFNKKGSTSKLAIYGLGYIKDLKLHKMMQDKLVVF